MSLKFRNRALLAKLETVYGTDPVPTGAANAILARAITITPQKSSMVDRDLIRPYFGASEQIMSAIYAELECEIEMAGSGTAGTAPAWGPLMRACAMAETITASTKVEYAPITNSTESATLYFFVDGVKHAILGARGSFSLDMKAGALPVIKFKFAGLYVTVADVANPTVTLTGWKVPLPVNNTNTSAFSIHAYAGVLESLSVDMNIDTPYRPLIGSESVQITGRKPTGQLLIEAPTVAAFDVWTKAKDATLGALTITHGTTGGNKVKIDAPKVQIVNPQYQDQDGIAMLQAGMTLVPNAGNDEIVITAL